MNFYGIRFIMKLWLLERTSLGYGHTWTSSSPSIMSQTSLYLLLEQKEREGRIRKRKGKGRWVGSHGQPVKKIMGSLIFWGKRFGTWEKIQAMGS